MNKVLEFSVFDSNFLRYSLMAGLLALHSFTGMAKDTAAAGSIDISPVNNTADNSIYPLSYFDQYLPQNAFQMIERLPGFNFDSGANQRGFGGNAGNVLIDGARPTSKSGGLSAALIRIPAAQVVRIEILRASEGSGEAAGQSIVANVIRKTEGTSGTWAVKLRRDPSGEIQPNIEAAINTSIGDWKTAFDVDIGSAPVYQTAIIADRVADQQLSSSTKETFDYTSNWLYANGEGSSNIGSGLLTINTRVGKDRGKGETVRDIFNGRLPDEASADEFRGINEKNTTQIGELGVNWTDTHNDWKLHVIGLGVLNDQNFEVLNHRTNSLTNTSSHYRYSQAAHKTEYISRITYGYVGKSKFKPEFGLEIAKNKLTSQWMLFNNGLQSFNDSGKVVVAELRSDIFTTFVYQASDALTIKGGLTTEFSNLQVSGERPNKKNFTFIKPRLSATYRYSAYTQFSLEGERRVAQLDFNDFANSVEAIENRTTSGNSDLEPSTTDEIAANYDWSFSERGSLNVKIFHQWRSDILEQIILSTESNATGLGNAGDATFWGVETNVNLPLDWILPKGLIELSHSYADSRFNDPVINGIRTVNGYTPNFLSFKLRQDIVAQKLAWGLEYWGSFTDNNFYVDEIHRFSGNKRIRVFVETSRYFGVKTQLEVTHLNTGKYTKSRFFYEDNRGGDFQGSEVVFVRQRAEIKLSIFGTF